MVGGREILRRGWRLERCPIAGSGRDGAVAASSDDADEELALSGGGAGKNVK